MTYDTMVPHTLKKTQEWFASIITRPIDNNSRMMSISPCGVPMEKEASEWIIPSPTLQPHERIQIYNQQYWWRLLKTLHDGYPIATRLFGYYEFNQQIAVPYLLKYHPIHWSLSYLGDRLPQWVEEEYYEEDRQLILDVIAIDWAFNDRFFVRNLKPLSQNDLNGVMDQTLYLQPSFSLFSMDYDMFNFRKAFLKKEVDYWIDHDFPDLDKSKRFYTVLYRNANNNINWEHISHGEYLLLEQFKKGATLEQACEVLEEQQLDVVNEIQVWFQRWTREHWLTLEKDDGERYRST